MIETKIGARRWCGAVQVPSHVEAVVYLWLAYKRSPTTALPRWKECARCE